MLCYAPEHGSLWLSADINICKIPIFESIYITSNSIFFNGEVIGCHFEVIWDKGVSNWHTIHEQV